MPSPSPQSWPLFAVQVQTAPGIKHEFSSSPETIEAASPQCQIEGWFLSAEEGAVHGIRVVRGDEEIAAKRKQLRPDVLRRYPGHPDALLSGFKADVQLKVGPNDLLLEFRDGQKKWHTFARLRVRLPRLWRLGKLWQGSKEEATYEQWLKRYDTPSAAQLQKMRSASEQMVHPPRILVALFCGEAGVSDLLRQSVQSLRAQSYPYWDLALDIPLEDFLLWGPQSKELISEGHRLKAYGELDPDPDGPSGDFVVALRAGDLLAPQALFHLIESIQQHPKVDLFRSDFDIAVPGESPLPYFSGAWDAEQTLYDCRAGGLLALRCTLAAELKLQEMSFPNWGALLKIAELGLQKRLLVHHLPHVLCHHSYPVSDSRLSSFERRFGIEKIVRQFHVSVLESDSFGKDRWRIEWPLPSTTLVSIIIPTHNRADLLRVALDSLFARTKAPSFDIIIVDHASDDPETLDYLKELAAHHLNVQVVRVEGPFNWSYLNNLGVERAQGDILVFLNNDVEIIEEGWLRELASNAWRPDVGAVGACLLYPDGSIQHAGIVLGMTGLAGHVFRTLKPDSDTMAGRPDMPREVTAVTGACLAVRRSVFEAAEGFDEEHLPVSYNDVDFCLKLRASGLRNLYVPFAKLIHHESVSRRESEKESLRKAAASEEARVVLKRWPKEFQGDAFYSPNLSLEHEIPTLGNPPPRLSAEA